MSQDCIFCKIFNGEIPSDKVYESENVIGFKDLYPQTEIHLIFIHKHHEENVVEMMENNPTHAGEVLKAMTEYARKEGIVEKSFRVLTNIGEGAGQTIFHTHFHLMSGKRLKKFEDKK